MFVLGAHLIEIRDNPWHSFYVGECVEINGLADPQCDLSQRDAFSTTSPLEHAVAPQDVHLVDFTDLFCSQGQCPAVIGNVLVYRDKHHVTGTYMRTMAPAVWERLAPIFMAAGDGA